MQDETVHQNLLSSKSRFSKRDLSIPRLEFIVAAHMAANLLQNANKAISFSQSLNRKHGQTVLLFYIVLKEMDSTNNL